MKRIVYACPVDWRWIKQRPQFLAEELNKYFDVHVIYPFSKNRRGLQKKVNDRIKKTPYFSIPTLNGRIHIAEKINKFLVRIQIERVINKKKPDILWIALPEQEMSIPKGYKGKVVYDCMDDYAAFNEGNIRQADVIRMEENLIRRADLVFASSENLKRRLCQRYDLRSEKIVLIRNGFHDEWSLAQEMKESDTGLKIGYFGTISHWFDFDLLMNNLDKRSDVEYHLYGPLAKGVEIPQHSRIIYHGVVEHDEIRNKSSGLDALMMPFQLNELVLSVDPVKLYEYICLNKNILCVLYPEVERFAPFAQFYRNQEEFDEQVSALAKNKGIRYTAEQAEDFLRENSWKKRAEYIYDVVNQMWRLR